MAWGKDLETMLPTLIDRGVVQVRLTRLVGAFRPA
jgi:hypothetical protein